MKKTLQNVTIGIALLIGFTMCARPRINQTGGKEMSAEASAETNTEPSLLYKISGNGLERPSYLYGTIHIICPADFTLAPYVEQAVKETSLTVLELDMDDPDLQTQMQQSMINPGLMNFTENMDEESRTKLDQILKKQYGAGVQQLGIMKPFVIQNMLLLKYLPCAAPESYEGRFIELSQQQEQEIIGLETVAYQFSVFDSIPQEEQIAWIEDMINDSASTANEFSRMVEAYKAKDVERLLEISIESEQFLNYADLLLYQRNQNWIPRIEQIVKEQSAFIAVGAGHLGGQKGVISLLQDKGYTVEPVRE
ncbi:TraB/GumN family protein [Roseivirga sp. BDSF3-8]|uniref:TraB/GumN family protein n=1 Tax=Roseivirga sp. BDSF3-8 TaxID=3241598 RepID=UPI003531DC48